MLKKVVIFSFLITGLSTSVYGQISFHGDARVRPRYDQKFVNGDQTYKDFYYMYWVRLWMDAALTDG